MDVFKVQLEKIKQQLAGLTATQRMLVATLVTLLGITIYYWGHYAGTAEMEPVMDQPLSIEEVGAMDSVLDQNGIVHIDSGGRVLVPSDRKMQALADLTYAQVLPHNSQSAFEELSKNLNPFSSPSEREAFANHAVEITLGRVIGEFPNVIQAEVVINAKNDQRIEGSIPPTATVFMKVRDGADNMKVLTLASATGVAGTVSGLTRGHVSVVINGQTMRVPDLDSDPMAGGDDYLSLKKQSEQDAEEKIRQQFPIPGLTVSVLCDVENRTTTESKDEYDTAGTLAKEVESQDKTEETTSAPPASAEPGAGANTAASIAQAAAPSGGNSSTISDSTSKTQIFPGHTVSNISTPAGKPTIKTATVGVPRGYMIEIYKQQHHASDDPSETELANFSATELANMKTGVKTCLDLPTDDAVWVNMYTEPSQVMATATPAEATPSVGLSTVTAHAKEIAVGLLAVVSLFMMSSMVRKSTPAPVAPQAPVEEAPQILTAGDALAGEAAFSNTTLDGMELDEEAVRSQQMLDQVTTMVKENPEGAATLVKRWLNRS